MTTHTSFAARIAIYYLSHVIVFLVGVLVMTGGGSVDLAIGTSLVAAGVAGALLGVYALFSQSTLRRLEALSEFGFREAFEARSARIRDVYDARLADARGHIDLLGFGQRQFREDYGPHFEAWVATGVKVRILLLDPGFLGDDELSLARQRDNEEHNAAGSIQADVETFLTQVEHLIAAADGKFQVRLYTCIPTVNVFRIDDELFWGPYLMHEQSRNSPTFLVDRGGKLYDRLLNHFETIWSSDDLSRDPRG